MIRIHLIVLFLFSTSFGCKNSTSEKTENKIEKPQKIEQPKPVISFTFDDGNTSDLAGFEFEEWNEMILSHLEKENLKVVFFVSGRNKTTPKGKFLLDSWDNRGHSIANHSFSHPNFNFDKNTSQIFEKELIKTDSIISKLNHYTKLFRFPYLKEGQNQFKVDSIRNILKKHEYSNGYVTIDASDWYVNQRLIRRINKLGLENTEIDKFKDFFIQHILDRANFYEKLSYQINQRHISHSLLLHHNLTSALFLDDLIEKFKAEGWEVIDADKAFQDKVFSQIPKSSFAGESLIYSMAKQSGKYNQLLRYPAEDGRYEKTEMDRLGL